ncbi:MAG: hypothetical protein IJA34_04860 [Lachnospiraceae bacterium]|nr:hypothetical protein [Lachnospiraceae bacterium]
MTNKEAYKIWAPYGKKWVDWVRPVPFVSMNEYSKKYNFSSMSVSDIDYVDESFKETAIIVDLPGVKSVAEGISLAMAGYRPIPIYNGTIEQSGARATVDNQSVGMALISGAEKLADIDISDEALPAFLLDSNRMNRFKMEISVFDNSWDIYHQDLPSADYFINNGIQKIVVVGERISKDLKKIFYGFQKKGISIYLKKEYEKPKKIIIRKQFDKD